MKTAPAAVAATLTLALVVAGCAPAAEPGPGEASSPVSTPSTAPSADAPTEAADAPAAPEEAMLVHASADEVADQVAAVMWASDTRTDNDASAAAGRAAEWLTPQFAQTATQAVPTGADWLELVEHEGTLVPEVVDVDEGMDAPQDTESAAVRTRLVTLTPTGRDGWVGEPRILVATLTLVRETQDAPWLVDALTVDESFNGTPDDPQDFG